MSQILTSECLKNHLRLGFKMKHAQQNNLLCTERVKMSLFGAHCTPLNLQKKKKKQAGVSYDVALRMPLKSHEGQSTSEISVAAGANTSQGVSRNLMCECVY